jgi:hypothetical protein
MSKHTEQSAISKIQRNGFTVAKTGKKITSRQNAICGIGTLGALDYLCNWCGYIRIAQ